MGAKPHTNCIRRASRNVPRSAIWLDSEYLPMPGKDTDQPLTDVKKTPEDAFALVGNKIRAEIIQVLEGEGELSFSELRSRMAANVDPSQLHYHLQQLVDHFVTKTDDGYRLSAVGRRLCQTLRAGTFDRQEEHLVVDANFDCYYCLAGVKAIFDSGHAKIECPGCEDLYLHDYYDLSLEAFEDEEEAFSHFSKYVVLKILFLARQVCPTCANPLRSEFHSTRWPDGVTCPHCDSTDTTEEGTTSEDAHRYRCHTCDSAFHCGPNKVWVCQTCDSCDGRWWLSVGKMLLSDPVLISFCYDHGVDIRSTPFWELEFAMTDEHVTVHSTDPWEVGLEVTFDDDTLELVVDGDLNVIERNYLDTTDVDKIILPDKDDCYQALRRHRWPEGVKCPDCSSRNITKMGTTSNDVQRYRCHNCGITFNDLTDTVFADHQLTLPEMFHIIREMDETEMTKIAQHLDRSYPAIVDFVHQVQDAADEESDSNLSAVYDADEIV